MHRFIAWEAYSDDSYFPLKSHLVPPDSTESFDRLGASVWQS